MQMSMSVRTVTEAANINVSTSQAPSIVPVTMATECRMITVHVEVCGLHVSGISQFVTMCLCEILFVFATVTDVCVDVNECRETSDHCHHFCINTLGGYTCGCEHGYSLQEDGITCEGRYVCLSVTASIMSPTLTAD